MDKGIRNWRKLGRPATAPLLRYLLLAVTAGLMLANFEAAAKARSQPALIRYTLAPIVRGGAITALSVTMHFVGDHSGLTRIGWVDSWAGEHRLGQWARDFRVEGARSVTVAPNGTRIVRAVRDAPLVLSYRIISAYDADPTVDNSREPAPVIRPGWFYAAGEVLFARPEGRGDDDRPARFRWNGPASISFASDLQNKGGILSLGGITESILIGGRNLHVTSAGPPGHQIRVARIGHYSFDGSAFDRLALRVVQVERDFWRASHEGPFLVTMSPVISLPGHSSFMGTGRGDAFALWMDTSVSLDRLTPLLAHEYFHTWNPVRLGNPQSRPAERGYWFSEGFTDFYAARLMLRAGLISSEQFADNWNEKLRDYAGSRYRTETNDRVAADFWRESDAEAMQYQRGAMLAVLWNRELHRSGHRAGLDGILRAQQHALQRLHTRPTAIDLFVQSAAGSKLDVKSDIASQIEHGDPILLPPDSFGRCARVETVQAPQFDRGWDVRATAAADNIVTGLDPGSAAYAAGLRNGMKLLERTGGEPGNPRVDYVLRVADGTQERILRFRPAGQAMVTVQELVLNKAAFAAEAQACRLALAG